MKNIIQALRHIRELKNNASTDSICDEFSCNKEQANELIDYLEDKGFIKEPIKMLDGSRIGIKISSEGMDIIIGTK